MLLCFVFVQNIYFFIKITSKMKSQDETAIDIKLSDSIFSQTSKEPGIKCVTGNEAFEYCFNENCLHQIVFLCGTRKCKCRQQHKLCPKADLDFTIQHVTDKIVDTTQIKQNVDKSFDKMIDHLSQLRDKVIAQIDEQVKYSLLHEVEKIFIEAVNKKQVQKFSAKESFKLWNVINKKYAAKNDIFSQINQQINSFHQVVQDMSEVLELEVQTIIKKQELIQIKNQISEKSEVYEFFKNKSSVLTLNEHINSLHKIFQRKIQGAELIFKASDHKFDLKKYYELCGSVTNTMVICRTNKDKIIGGYTPLAFNPLSNKMEYIADESCESIIFSLTQNDKFQLKDKSKAIRHMPDKSHLRIGNAQFDICDKADTVQDCYTYLTNQFYSNPKYKNDKESYLRLTGNQSFKFMTKEWEVWKMQFQPEQD